MSLFKKKRDLSELKLPESPMFFPELPQDSSQDEEMPSFSGLKPISMNNPPPFMDLRGNNMHSSELTRKETLSTQTGMAKLKEPMFIKIDKYREALANFELIKKKLQETSSLLEQIKDTRKKEEAELTLWTQEMESIKMKIGSIDKKIFGEFE